MRPLITPLQQIQRLNPNRQRLLSNLRGPSQIVRIIQKRVRPNKIFWVIPQIQKVSFFLPNLSSIPNFARLQNQPRHFSRSFFNSQTMVFGISRMFHSDQTGDNLMVPFGVFFSSSLRSSWATHIGVITWGN